MSNIEPVAPERRLRIAVLGDFEGEHTRSWVRWFVERGHEVHAISYYRPAALLPGIRVHALIPQLAAGRADGRAEIAARKLPPGLVRLANGVRYRRAGLKRALDGIRPDVFHGHFVVEHGFYGALAAYHPYVVTAWGSDVLVAPDRDPMTRLIARWALRQADGVTSNNAYMARRITDLGARQGRVHLITLGADAFFAEEWEQSVNVRGRNSDVPVVLSTRAHEPLYNIGDIIDAFVLVQRDLPDAKLVIAHAGSLTDDLRAKARKLAGPAHFPGTVPRERLRELMSEAEVFVSMPSSDGTSVALLQAMAAGAFPVVSDLPTQHEWIKTGVNGALVAVHDTRKLAAAIVEALSRDDLRRSAAKQNRALVAARGTNETQMLKMEQLYIELARLGDERTSVESPMRSGDGV